MANSFLQVRVNEEDKEKAARILDSLGTNLSTVVNMLVKQIIITESIPFDVRLNKDSFTIPQAQSQSMENDHSLSDTDPVIKGIREEYEW